MRTANAAFLDATGIVFSSVGMIAWSDRPHVYSSGNPFSDAIATIDINATLLVRLLAASLFVVQG